MLTVLLGPILALQVFTASAITQNVLQAELAYNSPVQTPRYVVITVKANDNG